MSWELNGIVALVKPYFLQIEHYAVLFASYTKSNPVVGGMGLIWVLGVITAALRSIPNTIYNFLERQFTVTITIHNREEIFFHMLKWYEKNGFGKKSRTLRVNNGRWGGRGDKLILSAGFGYHYFWRGFRPFKLWRIEEKTEMGMDVKEQITITTIGRSQYAIRKLIEDIVPNDAEERDTRVYGWASGGWQFQNTQPGRPLASVVLPEKQLDQILNHIEQFKKDRRWYIDNGIPYRMGICTTGPPGTGKTSLARALCDHLHRDLYRLSLNWVSDIGLENALNTVSDKAIVLIEDIDTFDATKSRKLDRTNVHNPNDDRSSGNEKDPTTTFDEGTLEKAEKGVTANGPPKNDEYKTKSSFLTLSGVLNAIDGVTASDGRILLMTTNAPTDLDPALLREGRIDLMTELGYLCDETFRKMFKRFYPEFELPSSVDWKERMTPATLQGLVIKNKKSPNVVLQASCESHSFRPEVSDVSVGRN